MHLTKSNTPITSSKLSVLIHQDGLSFYTYTRTGILEQQWDVLFGFVSNPIEILTEIEKEYHNNPQLAQASFDEVNIIYDHSIFAGVPGSIFKKENAAHYLQYNNKLLPTDVISHDDNITTIDYTCVYIAYTNINNFFYDKYGDFNYYHYTSLALPVWYKKHNNTDHTVVVDVRKSHIYITVFDKSKLIVHNIYPHQAIEDILYYSLFTCQHNGLDPENLQLYLVEQQPSSSLYDLLYTYIRHVKQTYNSPQQSAQILCV